MVLPEPFEKGGVVSGVLGELKGNQGVLRRGEVEFNQDSENIQLVGVPEYLHPLRNRFGNREAVVEENGLVDSVLLLRHKPFEEIFSLEGPVP